MSEQLDRMDKEEFDTLIGKAAACTRSRDFACADSNLQKATKLATSSKDRQALAVGRGRVDEEKRVVAREEQERVAAAERRRRQAENEERESQCADRCSQRSQYQACVAGRMHPQHCEDEQTHVANSGGGVNYGAAILEGLNRSLADQSRITAIHNQAMANVQAALAERRRQEQAQRDHQRAQQAQQQRAAAEQRTAQREREERSQQIAQANAREQAETQRQRDREREREQQHEQARRADAERQRQAQIQEAQRKEQERQRQEQERQRQEQAKAERLAQVQAEKAAAERARVDYLASMRSGIRLAARKCPDGEGKYYIVGTRPRIKPEAVSCVDVHYRAQCTNSTWSTDGVGPNFLGAATDCFMGDAYPIAPTPACKVESVRVTVRDVRACGQ